VTIDSNDGSIRVHCLQGVTEDNVREAFDNPDISMPTSCGICVMEEKPTRDPVCLLFQLVGEDEIAVIGVCEEHENDMLRSFAESQDGTPEA